MTKKFLWTMTVLAAAMTIGACAAELQGSSESPIQDVRAPAEQDDDTTTPSVDAVESEPGASEELATTTVESSDRTEASTNAAAAEAGFTATIGGARYETETHECFELGNGALAISGEGSGPSGPFQFFMQAGLEEEMSFKAGDFVVFVLPTETDLHFAVTDTLVRGQVTLAVDKVLVIAGNCETEPAVSADVPPAAGAASLLAPNNDMVASQDGSFFRANSYGCSATASGGLSMTGSGITDDGLSFSLYLETGRDIASLSVDGVDLYVSGFTDEGQISITQEGDVIAADAVAINGESFAIAGTVCDGF